MKYSFPFLLLFCVARTVFSQQVLDTNPPSVDWYQINTPYFRLLFSKDFEAQAQRMANTLEHIREAETRTLGSMPRKISVILQNRSSISNGFVSILPRRSEFYSMPSQNYNFLGNNDWLELLASHEYRHIVQYQHATRGFNKLFYYLFGSTTLAGMAQVAAPGWFWEGDAVVTETAFTPSGRGRIPNFGLVFKTNLMEGRVFNYHKQHLQSFKHEIPDEYVLGYYMVSYLRKRTNNPEIWGKISARSWSVPFIPFAFSNAIKKESGLYVTKLYREMAKDLQAQWKAQLDTISPTPFTSITPRKSRVYTDYDYPQVLDDGSVVAMKRGIGDIATFVRLKDGKEKKMFTPGFINDAGMLSVVNDRVVWSEYGFHPRWGVQNYSLVKTYDPATTMQRVIGSNKERYASAALSRDGRVVTIRTDERYQTNIVILDYLTGRTLAVIENPENAFYSMPRWSPDNSKIVVLKTVNEGKTISLVDVASGTVRDLIPLSDENIGHPILYGDYVLFNSPITGIDNIFALELRSGDRFQITSSRYGAYNPSVTKDGAELFYNDQTRNGLDVVKTNFEPTSWKRFTPSAQTTVTPYAKMVEEQEGHPDLVENIPTDTLPVKRYRTWKGIFNPYTWGLNVDNDLAQARVGISSRDLLSTTALNFGYVLDIAERTSAWEAQVSYQKFTPILDVRATYAERNVNDGSWRYQVRSGDDTVFVSSPLSFRWKETSVESGLRIPLNLTHSRFSTRLTFSNYVGYTQVTNFSNSINGQGRELPFVLGGPSLSIQDYVDGGSLLYNHFGITFSNLMRVSRRDINSKWGQAIYLNWYSTPYGGDYDGNQFSMYGVLYLPGAFKHHSLWGYGGVQSTSSDFAGIGTTTDYQFRNRIPVPRGLSIARRKTFYSASVNYTLPIWYPDMAIGPLLNIQRFRANVFYDYGYGISRNQRLLTEQVNYASTGIEVKADINIFRFYPRFDIGFRFTQGLQPSTTLFEVLIGTFNF